MHNNKAVTLRKNSKLVPFENRKSVFYMDLKENLANKNAWVPSMAFRLNETRE